MQAQIKAVVQGIADRVICKRNGTVEARLQFAYKRQYTGVSWAAEVAAALRQAGLNVPVTGREVWVGGTAADSYFVATISI